MTTHGILKSDELELLQEIMNIAFGQAAAELAELIDIFVVLSLPEARVLPTTEVPILVARELAGDGPVSMVEQTFWGQFRGSAFLLLPSTASQELVYLLGNTSIGGAPALPPKELEKETLLEVGNILIGACVSKLAELLEDTMSYHPPTAVMECHPNNAFPTTLCEPGSTAIVLKTLFRFSGKNVSGFLFLLTSQDSIAWLRKALASFLGRYA